MRMFWLLTTPILLAFACEASDIGTIVNGGNHIYCTRAMIEEIRIQGCKEEPCYIKKGTRLPVEVDFIFWNPKKAEVVHFSAFIPFWNIPGKLTIGSNLMEGKTCEELRLPCPTLHKTQHTLRTYLYADPQLRSTVGNHEKTGAVTTNWLLNPSGPTGYSQCYFSVKLIVTE